jgi:hypothetical protein
VDCVSAPNCPACRFRETDEANLSGLDEIGHRADCLLDRDLRIDAMLIVKVDRVDAEAGE